MPLDSTQLNSVIQSTLQSYASTSNVGGISDTASLFTSILQEKLAEQSYESVASSVDGKSSGGLESMLPMLLMNGIMSGGSSEASNSLMTALLLAMSTETGQKQLSGMGTAVSSAYSNGTSAYSAAQSAYSKAKKTDSSEQTAEAAVSSSGTAKKADFSRAATLISNAGNRSAQLYRDIIAQFDVENNAKYQPRNGSTFCNLYQQDVTEAMGAAIPHCVNTKTGAPTTKDDPDMMYMNANRTSDWLNNHGEKYGWYEVSAEQAQHLANQGHPAVTIWKNNSGGHGHCQIVSPSETGGFDAQRGVAISQAGRRLMNYSYITNVYSASLPEVQYFAHK